MVPKVNGTTVNIRNVWYHNVEEEFGFLRTFTEDYRFVAMDTEFPGIVATPLGTFRNKEHFNYQQVYSNVNMLKLIQVGFALVNDKGELPPCGCVWQFNLEFALEKDLITKESLSLLQEAGIDFESLRYNGIPNDVFGELLTTSGLLTDPAITWLAFSSSYDFGYLFKSITLRDLPKEEENFFSDHKALFPTSYDVKILMGLPRCVNADLKGGLQDVADQLDVKRQGTRHQAGSDALLTAATFFKIKNNFFGDSWDEVALQIRGRMFGLGGPAAI